MNWSNLDFWVNLINFIVKEYSQIGKLELSNCRFLKFSDLIMNDQRRERERENIHIWFASINLAIKMSRLLWKWERESEKFWKQNKYTNNWAEWGRFECANCFCGAAILVEIWCLCTDYVYGILSSNWIGHLKGHSLIKKTTYSLVNARKEEHT